MLRDVIAGLTLWAVFAAHALAYSQLAHATIAAGLMTAIIGALVYAALGSSRRTSIGPAGGIAAIVGAGVASVPAAQLESSIAALTLMTGAFLVVAGIAKISFLPRLFPVPVFVGYLAGTGVVIIQGQVEELVHDGSLAIMIGAACAACVLALKWLAPRIPGPFVVLLGATIASAALDLAGRGVPVIGSSLGTLGHLTIPADLGWAGWKDMLGPSLGLALIVYVDALANSNMLVQPGDGPIKPRREFFAIGGVNLVAGIAGGFVAGASSSRSLVGIRAGAKTRLAPVIAGVMLLLTALSVVRFLAPMPLPALAGVVIVAAFDLINVKRLRDFWHLRHADFVIAGIAGLGVIVLGLVRGVVIGILVALAEALRRGMYPNRSVMVGADHAGLYEPFSSTVAEDQQDVLVYRFGAPLFFGNADSWLADMRTIAAVAPKTLRTVVVNADGLGVPDATAYDTLITADQLLKARGIKLVFGNTRAPLRAAIGRGTPLTLIDEAEFITIVRRIRERAGRHSSSAIT
jgi:MFS superfamily sulfate permease-like transporter